MPFLNVVVPGERTEYRAESALCQAIVELSTESRREALQILTPGSAITTDGSWGQRRNASHCVIAFVDVASGKIADLEILEKPIENSDGNSFHSSNGMEVEDVRCVVSGWGKDHDFNARALAYIHNRDGTSRRLHGELWPGSSDYLIPITSPFSCTWRYRLKRKGRTEEIQFYIISESITAV
jgi:hypothetical protein